MAALTREQLEQIILNNGSVLFDGKLYTNVADLPSNITLSQYPEVMKQRKYNGRFSRLADLDIDPDVPDDGDVLEFDSSTMSWINAPNRQTGGTVDANFVYNQNIVSSIWIVTHNLNKLPSVQLEDSSGDSVIGDVDYLDLNTVRVSFAFPISGKVILN